MTIPTYAYGPTTLPSPIVTKTTGGNLTSAVAGTHYFCLQGQNRVGRNELSIPVSITVAAGDQIEIEIPEEARTDCSDWHYFVVAISSSATPSTFKQIALYRGYELDQVTPTTLPHTIVLSEDAHLTAGQVVLEPANLPTGDDLLTGMVRGVVSTTYFYTYHPDSTAVADGVNVLTATPGRWVRSGPSETYVDDIGDVGGCARDIRSLGNAPVLTPEYDISSNTRQPGTPIKLWRVNTTTEPILAGTRVGLVIQYNEETKSQAFSGLLKVKFLGYANPGTGDIDTSNEFATGDMKGVGQVVEFQPRKSALVLEKDLPVGQAYAIEVYPDFAGIELDDGVAIGADLKVYLFFYLTAGEYSEAGWMFGPNWIYPEGDKRRVVPAGGLSVALLSGSYMVECYSILNKGRSLLPGLQANTANQKICINGIGASWLETGTVPDSAALRALVGTVNGRGSAGALSAYTAIGASGQLQAVIPYPCDEDGVGTVRPDYPDRVAGNTKATFNPSGVTLYIQQQSSGEIREFTGTAVVAAENQQVVISDWSAGTVISSIPTAALDFGLFIPGVPTVSAIAGGGTFPSGNYRVSAAFDYLNRVTSISHKEIDGCIPEPDSTLVELFDRIRYHAQGAADLDALRAVDPSKVSDLQIRAVRDPRRLYLYDATSLGVDDGTASSQFVRLSGVAADQPGRFVQYNELFQVGTVETGFEGGEASVWITPGPTGPEINFSIPEGRRGLPGPPSQIRIGSVEVADFEEMAEATLTGVAPFYELHLKLPKAERGPVGPKGERGPTGSTGDPMDPDQFIDFVSLWG